MRRLSAYLFSAFLLLSVVFLGSVLAYTGFGRVTDSSLEEQESSTVELENRAREQALLAEHWWGAENEYNSFREKYLINLDRFAEFRRSLDDMIIRRGLISSGFKYTNRNSPDGKLTFVRFSFAVRGTYGEIRQLIWELEHLPHAARIGSLSMQQDEGGVQCGLELEVVFEK